MSWGSIFHFCNIEDYLLKWLTAHCGIKNAIRIEDFAQSILALIAGYSFGLFRAVFMLKNNYRFNNSANMRDLVFQRNEYKGIVEYDFKPPKNFIERIDLLVGLFFAKRKHTKLNVRSIRWYTRASIIFLLLCAICVFLIFCLGFHISIKM